MCHLCETKKCRPKRCKEPKLINHCDLPYTISKPGCYKACEDLKYDPKITGTSAITVESDNVVLDLGCHRLYQKEGNLLLTSGVKVNSNVNKITITGENGTIEDFKGWGIDFEGPNSDSSVTNISVLGCGTNRRDENLNALDGGINMGRTSPPPGFTPDYRVTNTLIDNVRVGNCKNFGVVIFSKENLTVSNSTIENIVGEINPLTLVGGLLLLQPFSVDISGKNVRLSNNTIRKISSDVITLSSSPLVGIAGLIQGVLILGYTNLIMENIQVSETTGSGTGVFCTNYLGGGNTNCVYKNCQFTQCISNGGILFVENFHTSTNTGYNGLRKCGEMRFSKCLFSDVSAIGATITGGLQISYGKNYVVEDCQIKNIHNPGAEFLSTAVGLFIFMGRSFFSLYNNGNIDNEIGSTSNIVVKNTEIQEIFCENGLSTGITYDGGLWNSFVESEEPFVTPTDPVDEYNLLFKEVTVQNVKSNIGPSTGVSIDKGYFLYNLNIFNATGFNFNPTPYKITNELKDVVFKDCIITDCLGNDASSAGIQICAVDNPSVSNCILKDCTNGILLTGGNIPAGSQLGIYPSTDFDFGTTERGLITSNKVDNIIDLSVDITNVEIVSEVATVTMIDTTGYVPLNYINVSGIANPSYVNGTWLIQSVTPTTVSFALLGADFVSTPVSGSAVKGAAYLNLGNSNNVFVDNIAALAALDYVNVGNVAANNNRTF